MINFTKIKFDQPGFTLAEMLVTVGIFAITMAISSSIFINVNNLQQQTASMAKLQNEGRYVMEKMSKEIRGRELDYDAMAADLNVTTGVTKKLVFKTDEFGDAYEIYFDTDRIKVKISNVSEVKIADLTAFEIIVDNLEFIVSPAQDPYEAFSLIPSAPIFEQPRVTIMLVIKNRNVPEKYKRTLLLQTTISSKVYR
ncbi:MAG: prepilin-type N-terminal cleavage/methylation domain-containing protein [Candidatus Buchananbacteria bacterium]|jgi:prepilin-type N-terminal cleavage/methylation domain-containing protein